MVIKTISASLAAATWLLPKNCYRCGVAFMGTAHCRICDACRKPRVRSVRLTDRPLTFRQHQIVDLIIEGKLNKEIAWDLHLSPGTIKTYLNAIFQKCGVTNRTELAVLILRQQFAAERN